MEIIVLSKLKNNTWMRWTRWHCSEKNRETEDNFNVSSGAIDENDSGAFLNKSLNDKGQEGNTILALMVSNPFVGIGPNSIYRQTTAAIVPRSSFVSRYLAHHKFFECQRSLLWRNVHDDHDWQTSIPILSYLIEYNSHIDESFRNTSNLCYS